MNSQRLRVGLYVNDTKATTMRFARCLCQWDMAFASVWRDELAGLKPGAVDVLLLHGGWYGIDRKPAQEQYEFKTTPELKRRGDAVRAFVKAGGGAVGVCAGSFNIVWLGLIEADISRMQGVGMHGMEAAAPAHPICSGVLKRPAKKRADRKWESVPVVRMNGPVFFPRNPKALIFSYDWEKRLGAVIAGGYGRGRAVAISPHPERTEHDTAPNGPIPVEPLMPAAGILRNALYWAAGRLPPKKEPA